MNSNKYVVCKITHTPTGKFYIGSTGNKNPFYGKNHSEATKYKIAKANKNRKPVNTRKVVIDSQEYESVTYAAKQLGVSPALVVYRLKSKSGTTTIYKCLTIISYESRTK